MLFRSAQLLPASTQGPHQLETCARGRPVWLRGTEPHGTAQNSTADSSGSRPSPSGSPFKEQLALQGGVEAGRVTHSLEGRAEVSDALNQCKRVLQVLRPKREEHSLNCGKGQGLQGGYVGTTLREGLASSSGHTPFPNGPLEREDPSQHPPTWRGCSWVLRHPGTL